MGHYDNCRDLEQPEPEKALRSTQLQTELVGSAAHTPQKQIPAAHDRLARSIGKLQNCISKLRERLESVVLDKAMEDPNKVPVPPKEQKAPIAGALDDRCDEVNNCIERVQWILRSLEL